MATKDLTSQIEAKFITAELVKKSNYIQSKCINVQWRAKDGTLLNGWWHGVPLKSVREHYLEPENWALWPDEIAKIQAHTADLQKYACFMVDLAHSEKRYPIKRWLKTVTAFLPPWIVFPLYHASSMGWKQEAGAEYLLLYHKFLDSLTEEERSVYENAYPRPCYLATWAQ